MWLATRTVHVTGGPGPRNCGDRLASVKGLASSVWRRASARRVPAEAGTHTKSRFLAAASLLILMVACARRESPTAQATPPRDVILVTIDGTRWQEIFEGTDPVLAR